MFSCEIYEIFKNTCLEEHLRTTASGKPWQILTLFLCYSIKDYIFLAVLLVARFIQGAQRKELIIAPFVKCFKQATFWGSHWKIFNSTLCNFFKDYICLAVSLVEGFVKGSQQKELTIASFVKRLKQLVWEGFTDKF